MEPRDRSLREPSLWPRDRDVSVDEKLVLDFVHEWFQDLSNRVPVDRFASRLSDVGLEVMFPERTLHDFAEFTDWYEWVGRTYADQTHSVETTRIDREGSHDHFIGVALTVLWTVTSLATGTRSSFRVHQHWRLRKVQDDLRIVTYRVLDIHKTAEDDGV